MDIVETENVKVANSVIVRGLTDTECDEDLVEFLNKHGHVSRHLRVDDPKSPFHRDVIVEYESCSALVTLEPVLPYTFRSSHNVSYVISLLSSAYLPAATKQATACYFAELQKLATISGKTFEELLQEQLSQATTSCAEIATDENEPKLSLGTGTPTHDPLTSFKEGKSAEGCQSPETVRSVVFEKKMSAFDVADVNPPEIQRVVVEHLIKNEGISHMHAPFRLRVFSGKIPRPTTEVDYDAWRGSVELILQDPSLSDLHRSRKILDSLLPPASEIVKHLGATALPTAYLDILDSAFDAVEDGDDLFARFLNTLQNTGEKPSLYLQRLQAALLKAIKRGAVSNAEADKQLLKQFCRGCWNDALITNLQLEAKRESPPSFSELLLQLRSEENRHSAKESRMRQHLNVHRHKVSSNVVSTSSFDLDHGAASEGREIAELRRQVTKLQNQLSKQKAKQTESDDVLHLKKQITELQSQFTKLGSQKPQKQKEDRETKQAYFKPTGSAVVPKSLDRPKPGYCFRCGEDGHIVSGCENDSNPSLVNEKRKQLRERQSLWDRQQCQGVSESLNWN